MADEVALDLVELRHLKSIATRPHIINFISSAIRTLEKMPQGDATAVSTPALLHDKPVPFSWDQDNDNVKLSNEAATLPIPILATTCTPGRHYEMLGSFGWEQNNIDVKIYIYLKGVDQENIEAGFSPSSFHIKLHDVEGKNYKFAIPELHKEIVPGRCRVITKPEKVVITLVKASRDYWLDLKFKEERPMPMPNWDEEPDPLAGFMGIMKNMYEEGDPEMKRTVAKAWTEAKFGRNP
ncbi:PREDICTED: calcyclin-binding [Prunus dulcis]|uniref:PREDICTED: calcyclin-binding n=1 Tax=Prunus dulcis TaxID=3755 RepID=A0A5E4FUH2_PRUDU|nr:calcyclin-binding protein [Prunus dulcis]VVA31113.1 PREDICTED: calcyclin-binding [Prunus dulcis]